MRNERVGGYIYMSVRKEKMKGRVLC